MNKLNNITKKITGMITIMGFAAFVSGSAIAASATGNAVGMVDVSVLNQTNLGLATIMTAGIKTSEQKDLILGVSLECGLYTRTEVAGKKGSKSTSTAEASVEVRVILDKGTLDERYAAPGWVTFCQRTQTLSATLGGVLEQCDVTLTDTDGDLIPDSGGFTSDDCTFSDEDIELILSTMSANHFNFILTDAGTNGSLGHTIDVEAQVSSSDSGETTEGGSYDGAANATIGNGSIVVDEVRLAKDISL